MLASDLSQTLDHDGDSKLGVLCSPKPRNANEVELDNEVIGVSGQVYADGFVYDPAIPCKEHNRLAKILRRRGDVEQQPRLSGIRLCGKVKTESLIVERVSGQFEEPGLRGGGYAILAFAQIQLGQTDMLQQGRRVNIVISKCSDCPSRGESSCRRQQAGGPTGGHLRAPFSKDRLV
jgi:hypothetical protein